MADEDDPALPPDADPEKTPAGQAADAAATDSAGEQTEKSPAAEAQQTAAPPEHRFEPAPDAPGHAERLQAAPDEPPEAPAPAAQPDENAESAAADDAASLAETAVEAAIAEEIATEPEPAAPAIEAETTPLEETTAEPAPAEEIPLEPDIIEEAAHFEPAAPSSETEIIEPPPGAAAFIEPPPEPEPELETAARFDDPAPTPPESAPESLPESAIEPALRAFETIVQEAVAAPASLDELLARGEPVETAARSSEAPAAEEPVTVEPPESVAEEIAEPDLAALPDAAPDPSLDGLAAPAIESAHPADEPAPQDSKAIAPEQPAVEEIEAPPLEEATPPVLQQVEQDTPELAVASIEDAPPEEEQAPASVAAESEPEPQQPTAPLIDESVAPSEPEAPPEPEILTDQELVAFGEAEAPAIEDETPAPAIETEPEAEEAAAFAAEAEVEPVAPVASVETEAVEEAPLDEAAPEADAAHADAAPAAQTGEETLPNFFRAAGDPDDVEETPPSFWERQRTRFEAFVQRTRAKANPKLKELGGNARAVGDEVLRRVKTIRHPRSVREAAIWSSWAAGAGVLLLVGFFFFVTWGMPSTDDLWEARNGQSITFLDRRGNVILREGAQNAPPVDLNTLPPYVGQAFIAIEDRRFYEHWGVDIGGMMRAGALNLRAGRVVQGGSTITQQLAKNLFLTNERSWRRKAQEIAMAIWLERRFSKREILALYLSRVYFGAGAYGIEAAAERYFDRPARELTLLQSAMIAGLVKAPSRLNPARQDIAAAHERADVVLAEMVSLGFISDSERQAAAREELVVSRSNPAGVLSYYRDWIDPLLNQVIGTQRDDFIVETTLDIAAQRSGAEAVETVLEEQGQSRRVGQAALVSLDDEGGVIAMVGGRDYEKSQFNRATQARRQPGSSFKYFIYLAAMEGGLTPWSIRDDAPITVHIDGQPDWTPGNYHEEFNGPVELARAFAQSYNMVAIRVANEVGGQNVIDVARRLGVRSELRNYHSLALGAQEVTLLEMTGAYGAMASQGYRVEPHGIVRIRRANSDETMWSWRQRGGRERVIEERPLRYMNYMMNRVVEAGTGTRARMPGRQIGGKTGTGNDYRDAWFIGFTPGIVTGVWVGNDNFAETNRVVGGSLPADIWARFMPTALRNIPSRELEMPGPEDYNIGAPNPDTPSFAVFGAPLGNGPAPSATPDDTQDRSLDFGPEG